METVLRPTELKRRFRYRKVTPDLFRLMKELKSFRLNYRQIAEVCDLDPSSVQYHLDVKQRKLTIARAKRRNHRIDAQKYYVRRNASTRHRIWMREYLRERYHKDPSFRAKILRANMGGRFAD